MKNWKQIAAGHALDIPAEQLERIQPGLDALEEAFRPLVKQIPQEIEPAVTFEAAPEEGQ